jgi:hypothetical protein
MIHARYNLLSWLRFCHSSLSGILLEERSWTDPRQGEDKSQDDRQKTYQGIPNQQGQELTDLRALCSMLYAPRFLLHAFCSLLLALSSMLFCCSSAVAEALSLSGNLNYISTEQTEDGEKLTQSSFFRNLYFTFEKPITPLISYQLSLRTNWSDFRLDDHEDGITKTYQRALEPAIDLFFRNPIYDFSTGYRRLEQWTTANLQNEGRQTTEFIYGRLNITPYELPALSLQFNRQKEFNYLSSMTLDRTDTRYTATSWYQYLYKGLTLSYNFTYAYDINESPTDTIEKTKNSNFNGLYNINYFKTLWNGKTDISASYQGNYIHDTTQFFSAQTGNVPVKRTPFGGFYAPGSAPPPDTNIFDIVLNSQPALVDNNFITGISTINLATTKYHNIGILVSTAQSVDRIFVYVNIGVRSEDLRNDPNLTKPDNWRVYWSNVNAVGTWQRIIIQPGSVSVTRSDRSDPLNNIFLYEIVFPSPQKASFFKVINLETVDVPGITNVLATEIEAYGTQFFSQGKFTETNDFFNQGINLIVNVRPTPKLNFSLNYFLNRSDQNLVSIWNSIAGVFSNLVSDSISDEDKLRSNILRTYAATATWYTYRLLTTTLRLQRNEAFDNMNETDFSSNTYTLSFNSPILPTLDTNLSFIRNDNYNFGEKESTNNSVLLSILAKLYKEVNMVTDVVYTRSKLYETDTLSNTTSIRGSINATLTQKLYSSLAYGLSWISEENDSSTSSQTAEGQAIVTYRPGRFINVTGNLMVQSMDEGTTTSEGILVDWLPVPALRLNLNYMHSDSDAESEPSARDLVSAYFIWYITKFLDLQVTYSYTHEKRDTELKNYTLGANLNWRVW